MCKRSNPNGVAAELTPYAAIVAPSLFRTTCARCCESTSGKPGGVVIRIGSLTQRSRVAATLGPCAKEVQPQRGCGRVDSVCRNRRAISFQDELRALLRKHEPQPR